MRKKHVLWLTAIAVGVVAAAFGSTLETRDADAADHLDPPARTNPMNMPPGLDRTADIGDLFAWHQGEGATATVTAVLTFDGPNDPAADQAVACDRDVLYVIHIDSDDDNEPDIEIDMRFGADDVGNCFLQVMNLPGEPGTIEAPVGLMREGVDAKVWVGLHDDPFFFDLQGYQETLMTGTLSFVNDRDFFARKNISAIVLEFPLTAAAGGGTSLRLWASTGRASS